MFCPADQPLLSRDTVNSLMLAFQSALDKIWRPAFGEEPGAPVLFPSWSYPELFNLPEGKGGGFVISRYPDQVRHIPVGNREELMDADTPEALRSLLDACIS